jgi:hypothetical protein
MFWLDSYTPLKLEYDPAGHGTHVDNQLAPAVQGIEVRAGMKLQANKVERKINSGISCTAAAAIFHVLPLSQLNIVVKYM